MVAAGEAEGVPGRRTGTFRITNAVVPSKILEPLAAVFAPVGGCWGRTMREGLREMQPEHGLGGLGLYDRAVKFL